MIIINDDLLCTLQDWGYYYTLIMRIRWFYTFIVYYLNIVTTRKYYFLDLSTN